MLECEDDIETKTIATIRYRFNFGAPRKFCLVGRKEAVLIENLLGVFSNFAYKLEYFWLFCHKSSSFAYCDFTYHARLLLIKDYV